MKITDKKLESLGFVKIEEDEDWDYYKEVKIDYKEEQWVWGDPDGFKPYLLITTFEYLPNEQTEWVKPKYYKFNGEELIDMAQVKHLIDYIKVYYDKPSVI